MSDLAIQEHRGAPYPTPVHIRPGQPTKYNQEIAEAICEKLARGVTRTAAAEALGISRITLRHWLTDPETYGTEQFLSMVAQAEARAEVLFTETMASCAEGTGSERADWRPAESWLKRRRRADYGDTLDIRKIDAETLLRLLQSQQEAFTATDQPAIEDAFDVL